jgi:hypothetical protein
MADCLPSARTCSLLWVIAPQTLFWTVHSKVSVHKWLRKRSRPIDGQPSHNPGKGKVCRQSAQDSASRFHQVSQLAGSQKYRGNRYGQQQIGSLRSEEQNVAPTGARSDVWLPSLVARQRLRIFRHFPEQKPRIFSPANQRLENRKGG